MDQIARLDDVRMRILTTAERLCGEFGLESVSVRDIAREAGVALSAVNYHFGSKANLLMEITRIRHAEIDAARAPFLDRLEQQTHPDLREILQVVFEPVARWREQGSGRQEALQFFARSLVSPMPELKPIFDTGAAGLRRIVHLIQRALPRLSFEDACWCLHFCMGIEHMNNLDAARLGILSEGRCDPSDIDEYLRRAVDYAEAAIRATAAAADRKPPKARSRSHAVPRTTRPARKKKK